MQQLTPFESTQVLGTTIKVTNAGDGLSQAMKVDANELHHGEVVHVVLECEVTKVRFDPIKDTDGLQRVHILRAGRAMMIDAVRDVVAALDDMQQRIDVANGVQRLPFDETQLIAWKEDHIAGKHETRIDGCPECDFESDLVRDGK